MELKVNELRIGNLVSHYGFIRRIEAILAKKKLDDKHRIIEFENGVTDFLMNVKPIPLTEEWLLKLGFKKKENGCFYHWNLEIDFYFDKEHLESDDLPVSLFFKYLHEIQNFYQSITGEELKYELD